MNTTRAFAGFDSPVDWIQKHDILEYIEKIDTYWFHRWQDNIWPKLIEPVTFHKFEISLHTLISNLFITKLLFVQDVLYILTKN